MSSNKNMNNYDHLKIEPKWQGEWDKSDLYKVKDFSRKPKFYILLEFPYPSGAGLHVGHLRSYSALDALARYKRMNGFNVLFPMGWDAFGLPTENYAIKMKRQPAEITKENIAIFKKQIKSVGLSFDWSREINTTDPDYYQWTQWIFLQLYKKGLAYRKEMPINWCPACKTGLANEEVVAGKCERCGAGTEKRQVKQWLLAITKYAERLIKDLDAVDYLDKIKTQQINWIGRSEGVVVKFSIFNFQFSIDVFTTRPDTLFGATFMVLAPEHELIQKLQPQITNWKEVEKYINDAEKKSDLERTDLAKEKTGVELGGVKAINPVNNKEVPIWVADYVLASYGTGAIMAVPAHDQRDWGFAKKYNILIKQVVAPFFKTTAGKDAVREGERVVRRNVVYVFVKHHKEDKYLCLNWKKHEWHTTIIGGVEGDEDIIESARREVAEETGYKNLKLIKCFDTEIHNYFYAGHKKENRYAVGHIATFELLDDERMKISEAEEKKHEVLWVQTKKMAEFLNLKNYSFMWDIVHNNTDCFTGEGVAVNSGDFDGLSTVEFKKKITKWLEQRGLGRRAVNYKLRDWVFSRQHYWGEPIPLVFCPECKKQAENLKPQITNSNPPAGGQNSNNQNSRQGFNQGELLNPGWIAIPEKDLPVLLPEVEHYEPTNTGESPLAAITDWVNTKCPKCGGPAKRETDTMPNWAGSSWYFLRYIDPHNKESLTDSKKLKYWMPVDLYNGGMEHTTLHLLYSRFWNKFLYDIGVVPTSEPYLARRSQGMVLAEDSQKMSKSRGNVVNPGQVIKEYGADALRLYEMFMGPFEEAIPWSTKSMVGVRRFLEKVWALQSKIQDTRNKDTIRQLADKLQTNSNPPAGGQIQNCRLDRLVHKTIKKVTEDIENFRFNTAISAMMILVNEFQKQKELSIINYQLLIILLSPFAPHLSEEIWERLGNKTSIFKQKWPKYNKSLIKVDEIELVIQVNGKVRDKMRVLVDIDESTALALAKKSQKIQKWLGSKEPKKVIFVKGKLLSIAV